MSLPDGVALLVANGTFPDASGYKVALYTTDRTGANATDYTATGETSGTGYTATGFAALAGAFAAAFWGLVTTTAVYDLADTQSGTGSTFTFRSLLVYETVGGKGLYYFNAGADQIVSNGQLTIIWPTPDASNGLVRLPQ